MDKRNKDQIIQGIYETYTYIKLKLNSVLFIIFDLTPFPLPPLAQKSVSQVLTFMVQYAIFPMVT